jgi:hypothetical protein
MRLDGLSDNVPMITRNRIITRRSKDDAHVSDPRRGPVSNNQYPGKHDRLCVNGDVPRMDG